MDERGVTVTGASLGDVIDKLGGPHRARADISIRWRRPAYAEERGDRDFAVGGIELEGAIVDSNLLEAPVVCDTIPEILHVVKKLMQRRHREVHKQWKAWDKSQRRGK